MEKKRIKVMIGIPNQGATPVEGYDNRIVWAMHMGALQMASELGVREHGDFRFNYPENHIYEFTFFTVGRCFTPVARELLCDAAVATNSDYIFMVDDDMLMPADTFERLMRHEVDLVAPLAFTRNAPFHPVLYEKVEGVDPVSGCPYAYNRKLKSYPRNQLVECDAVGFGAVLFKVDLLKKLKKPWYCLTSPNGEDVNFCYRIKEELGARVYMDTAVKLGHVGNPQIVDEKLYDQYWNLNDENRGKQNGQYVGKEAKSASS